MIIIVGKLALLYGVAVLHCVAEDIHPKQRVSRLIYDEEVMEDRKEYYKNSDEEETTSPPSNKLIIIR